MLLIFHHLQKIDFITGSSSMFFLAPLNITQPLTDINVLLAQTGTLSLTCDAFPVPKVTWSVDYL